MKFVHEVKKFELGLTKASLYAECALAEYESALLEYEIQQDSGVLTEKAQVPEQKSVITKIVDAIKGMFQHIIEFIKTVVTRIQVKILKQKAEKLQKYVSSTMIVECIHPDDAKRIFDNCEAEISRIFAIQEAGGFITPEDRERLHIAVNALNVSGRRGRYTAGSVISSVLGAGGIFMTVCGAIGMAVSGIGLLGAGVAAGIAGAAGASAPLTAAIGIGLGAGHLVNGIGASSIHYGGKALRNDEKEKKRTLQYISGSLQKSASKDAVSALEVAQAQCAFEKARIMYLSDIIATCGKAVGA